ncbi:MAG: prepilin-type N-terminal cleavage/methylation domain-containing protein, partial [Planctomycetes bacterium]|nr:prepilin-type N-terminal cleavage/methylation domain-containing protein [Planctomycetota bacterium]
MYSNCTAVRTHSKRSRSGFTLIELLVVIAIIALLISILLPSLSRARELSKRLVCQSNTKGIGTSCKIYANDNSEKWPIPPFDRTVASDNSQGIDYFGVSDDDEEPLIGCATGGGGVAYRRWQESFSKSTLASTKLSVTRAFWMLVRKGDVTVQQFICPSSGDRPDATQNVAIYYDFASWNFISYGYQVPFGPRDTAPREGADNRQILMADKGPWYCQEGAPQWEAKQGLEITLDDSPELWKPFNSPNHGGRDNGEGQNCLFADGHASFMRTPAVGID